MDNASLKSPALRKSPAHSAIFQMNKSIRMAITPPITI
jgi:hypothetical protein